MAIWRQKFLERLRGMETGAFLALGTTRRKGNVFQNIIISRHKLNYISGNSSLMKKLLQYFIIFLRMFYILNL